MSPVMNSLLSAMTGEDQPFPRPVCFHNKRGPSCGHAGSKPASCGNAVTARTAPLRPARFRRCDQTIGATCRLDGQQQECPERCAEHHQYSHGSKSHHRFRWVSGIGVRDAPAQLTNKEPQNNEVKSEELTPLDLVRFLVGYSAVRLGLVSFRASALCRLDHIRTWARLEQGIQ